MSGTNPLGWDYFAPLEVVKEASLALVCMNDPAVISPPVSVYSGFTVEIEGRVVWLTAAHGITKINLRHDYDPGLKTRFLVVADGDSPWVDFDPQTIQVVQLPELIKKVVGDSLGGEDEFFDALAKLMKVDAAFAFLPDDLAIQLAEVGLRPLPRNATQAYGGDDAFELLKDGFQYFLSGIPASSYIRDGQLVSAKCRFQSLAVRPKEEQADPPIMHFLPQWPKGEHVGSLVGMSGGPVCIVTPKGVYLEGIQYAEDLFDGEPVEIHAAYVGWLLSLVESALQEAG